MQLKKVKSHRREGRKRKTKREQRREEGTQSLAISWEHNDVESAHKLCKTL